MLIGRAPSAKCMVLSLKFSLALVATIFLRVTNSCMVGGSQGQVGIHKTADFTLTRAPRGHRTGCPPEYRREMGGREFGVVSSWKATRG
jgi:hypothetical protein